MTIATLYCGDALAVLGTLPEASVQCCVTSPPYWGLRDYGTARWEGGDVGCQHQEVQPQNRPGRETPGGRGGSFPTSERAYKHECRKCGARRVDAQLGLERTPEEYVAKMVDVFRAVRRVLRDDGTLWVNLGDSYAGGGTIGRNDTTPEALARRAARYATGTGAGSAIGHQGTRARVFDLKPKDLVGIPWRVAFALQADGWWLRSDIVWSKPNPMPESVTDRPTRAHEYVFLLSKSARYYYDAAAIAEKSVIGAGAVRHIMPNPDRNDGDRYRIDTGTRNARTVWEIATQPYPEAHFATFPEELARRCILAGSRPGDCVLDPFGGSGTVAQVATGNGRSSIYIDLNPAYLALAEQRIGPMLCERVA